MEGPFVEEHSDDIEATCEHIVNGITTLELKALLLPPVALHVADGVRRHDALSGAPLCLPVSVFRAAFSVWHAIVAVFPEHHADGDCAFLASRVFAVVPSISSSSGDPVALFDDIERNVRMAVNYVVRCRRASVGSSGTRSVRRPVVEWTAALLASKSTPDSLRTLALTLALLLGASEEILDEASSGIPRSDLVQIFLRGLNLFGLSDALVSNTLLSMITGEMDGAPIATTTGLPQHICGRDFYRVDLDVLIDMLRTMDHNLFAKQISSADQSSGNASREYKNLLVQLKAVRAAEEQLLADIAPSEGGTVDDVCSWFASLHLSRDYSERLRFEGVDGAVLWSDLTPSDVVEMGVDAQSDVDRFLSIVKRRR